jgi:hypothetical protein
MNPKASLGPFPAASGGELYLEFGDQTSIIHAREPSTFNSATFNMDALMIRSIALVFLCMALPAGAGAQPSYLDDVRAILDINHEYFKPEDGERGRHILACDFNKDGWPDILASGDELHDPHTYIYFGGPGILDDTADLLLRGGSAMALGDLQFQYDMILRER